jgi:hypothetical protein
VPHHLLARLILFVFHAHRRILTRPSPAAPVIGRELVRRALDAARPSAIGLLTGWRRLLNGHVGVAKTNDFGLIIGTGANDRLLSAAYIASWAVTG